jgi:hypothetical protein
MEQVNLTLFIWHWQNEEEMIQSGTDQERI